MLFLGGGPPLPNPIVLDLTDGGAGDEDGMADGRIVDPGGPALVPEPAKALQLAAALALLALLRGLGAARPPRRAAGARSFAS